MARGRMVSASISESAQVANLPDDTTRLIFVMTIPQADAAGRYSANPQIVGGKALTLLPYTPETITRALAALHVAGLIRLYEAGGQPYLVFTGWERHQKIRHDREHAKYPQPTNIVPEIFLPFFSQEWWDAAGMLPGTVPAPATTSASQVQAQIQVQEQPEGNAVASVGSRRPAFDGEEFIMIYNSHRGELPASKELNHKRRKGLERLVGEHGPEASKLLLTDATKAVAADPFWRERGYGLDNLLAQDGRVLEKAEKWRSGGTSAMMRATNAGKMLVQYEELGI